MRSTDLRSRSRFVLPLIAAIALLGVPPARAGDAPTKTFRDPATKCSFSTFPDWKQAPGDPSEEWVVAKFYDGTTRGDLYPPEMRVVRIVKGNGGASGPLTGSGAGDAGLRAPRGPRSAWEATIGQLSIEPGAQKPDQKAFKPITSADKVDGKIWAFTVDFPETLKRNPFLAKRDASLFTTLVTFEKDGVEFGICMSCAGKHGDEYKPLFKRIGQSFRFFNEHAGEVRSLDVLNDVNITPKKRSLIERSLVKGWDVRVSPKKNYIVIYNTMGRRNDQLATMIAMRIEQIREQVYEKVFPPTKPVTAVSVVRICGDRPEYFAYGGPPGSAGYWNDGTEELVFYDASPAKKIDDDTLAVLYHEAFHQFIYYSVGNVAPHSWFNEGHGDYFAGAKYSKDGKFKVEKFDWRTGVVKNAVAQGPRASKMVKDPTTGQERKVWEERKGYTPLADFVVFTQGEYYSYPSVSYAQGWSLIWFLREVVPKNPNYNKKWGKILETYFNVLKAEVAKNSKFVAGGTKGDGPDEPKDPPEPGSQPTPPGSQPTPPDPNGEEDPSNEPPPPASGLDDESALKKAIEEAFKGVDFAELEKAWVKSVKDV